MAKLVLGNLVATYGVAELMRSNPRFQTFVTTCLRRYVNHDWGDLDDEDREQNDDALESGDARILAAYKHNTHDDWRIWIITEGDRSVTTILFPHEY